MFSIRLFLREIKSNYKIILIFMAVITMYAAMITSMFDPRLGDSLKQMAESMPQIFSAFGMSKMSTTLIGFLTNYLYGFLLIVLPLVMIVLLSHRLVSRYIEKGSMAYLLSAPHTRRKIITTQALFLILSTLLLLAYAGGICVLFSQIFFFGKLDLHAFLMVNVGLFGMLIFLAGLCFCSACIFNEVKLATGIGSGICIIFVLLQMLSQVGDKFEWLKYLTPLTLFNTEDLIAGGMGGIIGFSVLYLLGIALFTAGIAFFCRKDIPV